MKTIKLQALGGLLDGGFVDIPEYCREWVVPYLKSLPEIYYEINQEDPKVRTAIFKFIGRYTKSRQEIFEMEL